MTTIPLQANDIRISTDSSVDFSIRDHAAGAHTFWLMITSAQLWYLKLEYSAVLIRCGNWWVCLSPILSGMVDLIVCYDASASPTRLVQRMGRAARKRDGSIVVLLTEGKEESVRWISYISMEIFIPFLHLLSKCNYFARFYSYCEASYLKPASPMLRYWLNIYHRYSRRVCQVKRVSPKPSWRSWTSWHCTPTTRAWYPVTWTQRPTSACWSRPSSKHRLPKRGRRARRKNRSVPSCRAPSTTNTWDQGGVTLIWIHQREFWVIFNNGKIWFRVAMNLRPIEVLLWNELIPLTTGEVFCPLLQSIIINRLLKSLD